MRKVLGFAIALVAASCAVPAMAQTVGTYTEDNGRVQNNQGVVIAGSAGIAATELPNSDGKVNTRPAMPVDSNGFVYNGTTWDRQRGTTQGTYVIAPQATAPSNAATNTITTANTSQQAFGAQTNRQYLFCQNPIGSATTLFVEIGAAASATGNSYELAPGGTLTLTGGVSFSGAVNVMSATAGARFICKQG